jgi:hypothetical protein
MDTTDTRVARLLKEGYLGAHPEINARLAAMAAADPLCTCGHYNSCHYGDGGDEHCGEPQCSCPKFEAVPDDRN